MLALAETESVYRLLITMNMRNVYVSGDIALVIADWSVKGRGADGSDVDMSGSTADVAPRSRRLKVRC